jgi:hypothetical protein
MINLGDKVKDSITGYAGTAIGRTQWLNGCITIGVQSGEIKDGKPAESVWFDEQRLDSTSAAPVMVVVPVER